MWKAIWLEGACGCELRWSPNEGPPPADMDCYLHGRVALWAQRLAQSQPRDSGQASQEYWPGFSEDEEAARKASQPEQEAGEYVHPGSIRERRDSECPHCWVATVAGESDLECQCQPEQEAGE